MIVRYRLEDRLRNKRECALRANDQTAEDLEGVTPSRKASMW